MEIKRSVCPYDCPDCCGLLVTVNQGQACKIAGDPAHPVTRGTLCPKMAHYERTVYSPLRLTTPLLRSGPKGEGKFTPITWDEAIQKIAATWQSICQHDGAEAILPYSFAGTMGVIQQYAGHALFYALGATSLDRTICNPAKQAGYEESMGQSLVTSPLEAQHSDFIILWGLSMLATNIHFKHDVDAARKKGAKLVCIDTYETRTAAYADEFIRVRPGTDGALALGLLYLLQRDGLLNRLFLQQYVQGWPEFAAKILPHYPPETVSRLTGVPLQQLENLAQAYGKARAPFIRLGSGLSRYGNGAMTTRLLTCLPAAVGAYTKPGGGLVMGTGSSRAFDLSLIIRPDLEKKGVRHLNMIELGEILTDPSLTPPIKSLFVYSSNPACTAPEQDKVIQGLSREDLFTVVHERFLTDTARYADIVLPATTSLEADDIYYSYGQYTLQCGWAAIPPLGESKSNWQVARLLASAMGLREPLFQKSEKELIHELIASTTGRWSLPLDREKLAAGQPVSLPLPQNYKLHFATPSGKIEIFNPRVQPSLPDYFPAYAARDAEEFYFINAPDPRVLDSSFNERPELRKKDTMVLLMHPSDAARHRLHDGAQVLAKNTWGEAEFTLKISEKTAPGTVVSEGLWWKDFTPQGNTNRLTAARTTDKGQGSTFYDVKVNIIKA